MNESKFIHKSLEKFESELKNINKKLDEINRELNEQKCQRPKCVLECNTCYIRKDEFDNLFGNAMSNFTERKVDNASKRVNMMYNIVHISGVAFPYVAMIVYLVSKYLNV